MNPKQLDEQFPVASSEAARKQADYEKGLSLLDEGREQLSKLTSLLVLLTPTFTEAEQRHRIDGGRNRALSNVDIVLRTGPDANGLQGKLIAHISALGRHTYVNELSLGSSKVRSHDGVNDIVGHKITYTFEPVGPDLDYKISEEIFATGEVKSMPAFDDDAGGDYILPWGVNPHLSADEMEERVRAIDESDEMAKLRTEVDETVEMLLYAASNVRLNPELARRILDKDTHAAHLENELRAAG